MLLNYCDLNSSLVNKLSRVFRWLKEILLRFPCGSTASIPSPNLKNQDASNEDKDVMALMLSWFSGITNNR